MVAISLFDYRILRNNSYLILVLYGICLFLLAGLHFFAPIIRGTRGWYKVGLLSLDPIEPTKIVLVILLAKYFSMRHAECIKFRNIVFSGLYVLLPAALIFIKPDLAGTMVLVSIWLGILLVSGIKLKHFLILSLCFLLVAGFAWNFCLKIIRSRESHRSCSLTIILGFLVSEPDKNFSRFGTNFGEGLAKGSQVQYGFLPEPHTDFIFSVISEEWGMIGVLVLFFVYGFLVWRVLKIAIASKSNFPRLFASGFAIILTAQFFINIGMNLSLLPVVGIYLPL